MLGAWNGTTSDMRRSLRESLRARGLRVASRFGERFAFRDLCRNNAFVRQLIDSLFLYNVKMKLGSVDRGVVDLVVQVDTVEHVEVFEERTLLVRPAVADLFHSLTPILVDVFQVGFDGVEKGFPPWQQGLRCQR